jgi:hypothetical protein
MLAGVCRSRRRERSSWTRNSHVGRGAVCNIFENLPLPGRLVGVHVHDEYGAIAKTQPEIATVPAKKNCRSKMGLDGIGTRDLSTGATGGTIWRPTTAPPLKLGRASANASPAPPPHAPSIELIPPFHRANSPAFDWWCAFPLYHNFDGTLQYRAVLRL